MSEKWDKRYINLVKEVATWSKDPSSKIGSIVVSPTGSVLAQGYNGFPRGIEDREDRLNDRSVKYDYMVHAEMNSIYNATYNGVCLVNSTIYIYGLPVCHECAKAIIQVGISRVVSIRTKELSPKWKDSCTIALDLFKEAGVEVVEKFTTND
jgi:dCMP deaminase